MLKKSQGNLTTDKNIEWIGLLHNVFRGQQCWVYVHWYGRLDCGWRMC